MEASPEGSPFSLLRKQRDDSQAGNDIAELSEVRIFTNGQINLQNQDYAEDKVTRPSMNVIGPIDLQGTDCESLK